MTKKKKIIFITSGVVVLGLIVFYFINNGKSKITYTTADVTKGTLEQTVSETGTITPAKEIDLNFTTSGQLTKIDVKVGDPVTQDQVLGEIDYSGLAIKQQEAQANINVANANVRQAQSSYDNARHEYDRLVANLKETIAQNEKTLNDLNDHGAKTITTYEQAILTAQTNLANTKSTYQRAIDNKFSSLEVTIDNKLSNANTALDTVNRVLTNEDLKPTLSVKNPSVLSQLKDTYTLAGSLVDTAEAILATEKKSPNSSNLSLAYDKAQTALNSVFQTTNLAFSALENTITSSNLSQAELDAFKASIDGQTTIISSALTALQTAKQALDDASLTYDTSVLAAEQNLSQAQTSYDNAVITASNTLATSKLSRDQQLAAAQASIDNANSSLSVAQASVGQASANLDLVKNQISDNVLKSPIKGVVTKINYEVGEQVTPALAFVSVLTENNYEIDVDISETDIAKVKLNDSAKITLDALGPDINFTGKVYFIEPASTVIQGVTYYKVKISFDPIGHLEVKPGMTASAVILTNHKENILIMPARAAIEQNGSTIVRILVNNVLHENPVTIGLSGDDGLGEVLSGVNEGDKVVTFVKDSSKN